MKVSLSPLYSQLNGGVGQCPLGCTSHCRIWQYAPPKKSVICILMYANNKVVYSESWKCRFYRPIFRDLQK